MTIDTKQHFLDRVLPYRLDAIDVLGLAVRYSSEWARPATMEIRFNGIVSIEGLSTGYTNPAIEAGVMHGRALLEFLGLQANRADHTKLAQRMPGHGRKDDLMIEDFASTGGSALPLVTPQEAVSAYQGPRDEAERGFARMIHIANKGLAHSTVGLIADEYDHHLLELVSRGVRGLFVRHFYNPMGLAAPPQMLKGRPRNPN